MKIGFFAFTGTGNTLRVCKILTNELQKNGAETEINLIKDLADDGLAENYDKIVIANPVHGFNTPKPMVQFLKSLPKDAKGKEVYLVRVSGEPLKLNNAAGIVPKRILAKKGYKVLGEFRYIMPYNIIFHHTNEMAARMEQTAKIRAEVDANTIINGDKKLSKNSLYNRVVSFACRIENVAFPISGRHYKTNDKCIGCGVCVKACPMNNIEIKDGKPVFGKNCVGCMGCAFGCPEDALHISFLNGWRVNGAYNFGCTPASDEEICDYCKKAYLRYFHEYDEIVNCHNDKD